MKLTKVALISADHCEASVFAAKIVQLWNVITEGKGEVFIINIDKPIHDMTDAYFGGNQGKGVAKDAASCIMRTRAMLEEMKSRPEFIFGVHQYEAALRQLEGKALSLIVVCELHNNNDLMEFYKDAGFKFYQLDSPMEFRKQVFLKKYPGIGDSSEFTDFMLTPSAAMESVQVYTVKSLEDIGKHALTLVSGLLNPA
jgi:hypothetical protein